MDLIMVFDAILTVRNYSVCMGIRWEIALCQKLNFSQFCEVKILGRYSPSLKDVPWLQDTGSVNSSSFPYFCL